jgi:hypothetical protein
MGVRMAALPNTSRRPAATPAAWLGLAWRPALGFLARLGGSWPGAGGEAGSGRGAARARTQARVISAERGRIGQQRGLHAQERDGGTPGRKPDDLGGQHSGHRHGNPEHVLVAVQDVGIDGGPGREEQRADHRDRDQQHDQQCQRHPGHGHDHDQRSADQVGADHHLAAGQPVSEPGQRHSADERRHHAGRERHGRQQRRAGTVVDQHGERDPGQLIAGHRKQLGQPQGTELGHPEHVAERGPAPVADFPIALHLSVTPPVIRAVWEAQER